LLTRSSPRRAETRGSYLQWMRRGSPTSATISSSARKPDRPAQAHPGGRRARAGSSGPCSTPRRCGRSAGRSAAAAAPCSRGSAQPAPSAATR
jgi:hypothetical protein